MTPEQLLNSLQSAPALRNKTFLRTAFATRQGIPMDALTPKEAYDAHVRIWTIICDALTEAQINALFDPIQKKPLYLLDDVLDKYAEHHKMTSQLYAEQNFGVAANDDDDATPEPMTDEDMRKLGQGWKTIDAAIRSGTLAEQVLAKAMEVALTEAFLQRQEKQQVQGR